jgi:Lar family restriction alleviation protein
MELKNCPFCGGEAIVIFRPVKLRARISGGTYYVHCKSCLIATQPRKKQQLVVEAWNRRADNV